MPLPADPHYLCSLEVDKIVAKVQIPGYEPGPGRSKDSYLCAHSLIELVQVENTIPPSEGEPSI